jgi:hypothetical protein
MINKLIDYYYYRRCENIVITNEVVFLLDLIPENKKKIMNINIIDDTRSATFFAYGKAEMINTPVILIVDHQNLSHCYTGLTEAWFQQVPVIVISCSNIGATINYEYLLPCICAGVTLTSNVLDDYKFELEKSIHSLRPTLINATINYPERKSNSYRDILKFLDNKLSSSDTVMCYDISTDSSHSFQICNIDVSKKYGLFSKYVGYLEGSINECIMISPMELFVIDSNIFNSRYINKRLKIILIDKSGEIDPSNWFRNNCIECKRVSSLSQEEIDEFINIDKPMVLFVNINLEGIN